MAVPTGQELIWQGRLHLGDEPGVYGDATYTGIGCELPITLRRFNPQAAEDATLFLRTEHVAVYQGYPGHRVTVTAYEESSTAHHWQERVLVDDIRITDENPVAVTLPLSQQPDRPENVFLSVRIRADTTVAPGLYDDFLIVSLSLESGPHGYYAIFGFDSPS